MFPLTKSEETDQSFSNHIKHGACTDLEDELIVARREGREQRIAREFGMDMYTLLD